MTYLTSATLFLLATAALIGSFTLVGRRLLSAIRCWRVVVAEVGYIKNQVANHGLIGAMISPCPSCLQSSPPRPEITAKQGLS